MLSVEHKKQTSHILEELFASCFYKGCNTILEGNAAEPLYQPGDKDTSAIIYYRHDYFASALHEIAHWCIAGEKRRELTDYGYWYAADGRNHEEQTEFLMVEVKPQALEWAFSVAVGYDFKVSLDNLNAQPDGSDWQFWQNQKLQQEEFTEQCLDQIELWLENGFPERGETYINALLAYYNPDSTLELTDFRGT